jgi:hypothetical protein
LISDVCRTQKVRSAELAPHTHAEDGDFMTEPDGTIDELTLERESGGS